MARVNATETLIAACPQFAELNRTMSQSSSGAGADRVAFTHALYCKTCGPIADDLRRIQAAHVRRLAAEAQAATERNAIPALDQAADVIEANGFHQHYLWDTVQADAGTMLEFCRVDVLGALGIVLYGLPTYAGAPRVRAVEQLLVERIPASSLAAWYSLPGVGKQQARNLLRSTAEELRTRHLGSQPTARGTAA